MPVPRDRAHWALLTDPARRGTHRVSKEDIRQALEQAKPAADPANTYLFIDADGNPTGCGTAEDVVALIHLAHGVVRVVPLGRAS